MSFEGMQGKKVEIGAQKPEGVQKSFLDQIQGLNETFAKMVRRELDPKELEDFEQLINRLQTGLGVFKSISIESEIFQQFLGLAREFSKETDIKKRGDIANATEELLETV
ncbi:MAG: hypothetical protein HQ402_01925 [Parcubacteria group bacterium]|nr:hypothetical protein [Parcubacteria group bacterium]